MGVGGDAGGVAAGVLVVLDSEGTLVGLCSGVTEDGDDNEGGDAFLGGTVVESRVCARCSDACSFSSL